jgi:hypothetical protein
LTQIFLLEEYISYLFIFFRIPVLMVASRVGKRHYDFSDAKCIDLSESCSTSTGDSKIGILEEIYDILLQDPFECLSISHLREIFFHSLIELTEGDDPLIAIISSEVSYDFFEYHS